MTLLLQTKSRSERLKDIGDHCLLFAGLFPQHAERRQVRLGHMVELGQNAYHQLHESAPFEAGGLYARPCPRIRHIDGSAPRHT